MKWDLIKGNRKDHILFPFSRLKEEFDSLFEKMNSGHSDSLISSDFSPKVDIKEDEKAIHVEAEIPGLDENDLDVEIKDNVLTIKGEKKEKKETKNKNEHRIERRYGSFARSFTLPAPVEVEKVKAVYKKGVLKLELPKDQTKTPKKLVVDIS